MLLTTLHLMSVLNAGTHRAGHQNLGIQCAPGAFQACAGVAVPVDYDPTANGGAGAMYVTVRVAYLQGTVAPKEAAPGAR